MEFRMSAQTPQKDVPQQQHWAEAVIECVSDKAERERLIGLYDHGELVKACLALGTLALTAKHEYQRAQTLKAALEQLHNSKCMNAWGHDVCRKALGESN